MSVRRGSLEFAYGELLGANINRSPTSYLKNPAEERARYEHDVDKEMTLLKVVDQESGRYKNLKTHLPFPSVLCASCIGSCNSTSSSVKGCTRLVQLNAKDHFGTHAGGGVPFRGSQCTARPSTTPTR